MDVIIAIAHIVGTFIFVILLSVAAFLFGVWSSDKNDKNSKEELSVELGIPVENLDKPEFSSQVFKYLSAKYSPELFKNRLSDLCGWTLILWTGLGWLMQIALFLAVIWFTFTDDIKTAVYAWWVIVLMLFFLVGSLIFCIVCRLLTGRLPGQAREARKKLAEYLNEMSKLKSELSSLIPGLELDETKQNQ